MDREEIEYSCDGVVVGINDLDLFYNLGKNGNTWNSNFALKMGKYCRVMFIVLLLMK